MSSQNSVSFQYISVCSLCRSKFSILVATHYRHYIGPILRICPIERILDWVEGMEGSKISYFRCSYIDLIWREGNHGYVRKASEEGLVEVIKKDNEKLFVSEFLAL